MEDEDGEVVKKYEIPPPQQEGKDYVATGLKYMGMGGLVKPAHKPQEGGEQAPNESRPGPSRQRAPTFSGWTGFGKTGSAEQKKAGVEGKEVDEEDDRQIRFTIGGVGRRMTKDDFLKEVQKLDPKVRREVVEQSNAPDTVKSEARKPPKAGTSSPQNSGDDDATPFPQIRVTEGEASGSSSSGKSPERPAVFNEPLTRGRSSSTTKAGPVGHTKTTAGGASSSDADAPETDAERRRRLAAFASVREDTEGETPAERRRREAALGTRSSANDEEEEDSDDDNTERIPPTASSSRRPGIRFADDAAARRKA